MADERRPRSDDARRQDSGRAASARDGERKPYVKRDGEKKPYEKRDGERKPYAPRDGERKPYAPRDGERKPYAPRDGERKPYVKRDGERKPYVKRDGDSRPYAPRDGERKPYAPRDGERKPYAPRDGERKPFVKRDGGSRPYAPRDGERKPYVKRDGDSRPYAPRDGERKPYVKRDGDSRPYAPRDGERKPYVKRDGDSRPYGQRPSRPPQDSERRERRGPQLPDDVTARDLHPSARNELKTLSKENAEEVARHLTMAARLIAEDPALAHEHALEASRRAGRIAIVRETVAITAYATGDFSLALRELRTYRRISGRDDQIALMVDSERGVGRPDRALEVGRAVDRAALPVEVRVELAIAMSGARLDLGETERALLELEIPELDPDRAFSWSPALFAARAAVLEELGRDDEAAQWYRRADVAADALAAVDADQETLEIDDLDPSDDEEQQHAPVAPSPLEETSAGDADAGEAADTPEEPSEESTS